MTCGVAVSASNYGTPLFNLLQSRSNYRSSRESLGVAFRERARTFSRITIHVSAHLGHQLSLSIVHHFDEYSRFFFFFFYLFRERNSRIDRMENETIKKSLNNCKSLVNSIKRFIFRISKACDRKFKYDLTGVIFSRTNVGQFLRILFFSSRV